MKSRVFLLKYIGAVVALVFTLSACSDDDSDSDVDPGLNLEEQLDNTTWHSAGSSCDSYFQFNDGNYLSLNPCYDDQGEIEVVAYNKGTYAVDGNVLKLTTTESCNSEEIGETLNLTISISGNILTVSADGVSQDLTKVPALPELPANAEFGYWDFENDGVWVPVESCSLED